jgi:hypothetical protein
MFLIHTDTVNRSISTGKVYRGVNEVKMNDDQDIALWLSAAMIDPSI